MSEEDKHICIDCKGEGSISHSIMDKTKSPPTKTAVFPPCDTCKGTGRVFLSPTGSPDGGLL